MGYKHSDQQNKEGECYVLDVWGVVLGSETTESWIRNSIKTLSLSITY